MTRAGSSARHNRVLFFGTTPMQLREFCYRDILTLEYHLLAFYQGLIFRPVRTTIGCH